MYHQCMAVNRRAQTRASCPGSEAFELLGKKWTAYVVWALGDGPRRFSELLGATPGVTDRVLSQRLKELEATGIVNRRQYAEIPPRVEYALTARGRDLGPVIAAMERWGSRWGGYGAKPRVRARSAASIASPRPQRTPS